MQGLDVGDVQEMSVRLQWASSSWTGLFIRVSRVSTAAETSVPAFFGVGATVAGGASVHLASCSASATCASCGAKAGCGWCGAVGTCLPGGAAAPSTSGI
eukprot:1185210-Prorocentrum_minimum.AAC.2